MYRVYDFYYKRTAAICDTWWNLIGKIISMGLGEEIAHNENDLIITWHTEWISEAPYYKTFEVYRRRYFVYDEYDRIINLNEIRQGIKDYKEPPRKRGSYSWRKRYFQYREDPVPYTGNKRSRYWRDTKHSYRHSYLNTYDILEDDPRINERINLGGCMWDDEFPRHTQRNWKKQRRTQWK